MVPQPIIGLTGCPCLYKSPTRAWGENMKWGSLVPVILIITILLGCSPKAPVTPPPTQETSPTVTVEETTTANTTPTQLPASPETTPPPIPTPSPSPTPTPSPTPAPSPTPTEPYTGPLFDDHLHLYVTYTPLKVQFEQVVDYLDRNNVSGVIGFFTIPPNKTSSLVSNADKIISANRNRIVPLLEPYSDQQFALGQFTEAVLRDYIQPKGSFLGVGEIGLYHPELQGVTFDSPAMQNVFKVVNEMKGIVMIHPSNIQQGGRPTELAEIEPAIREYPDIIFLFHDGPYSFDMVAPLMGKYPNVYFSIDFGCFYKGNVVLHLSDESLTANDFVTAVNRTGLDNIVSRNIRDLAPRIERYPDRVMWGTDLSKSWNFEESANSIIIKICREFIGRLPPDIQEKYAYQNAERVFGRFLTPNP